MAAKLTTEQFIEKAKSIHGDRYDYSETEYLGNAKKVKVLCSIHGAFYLLANDHLSKKAGCAACGGVKRLTQEDFLTRSKAIWGDKYDYTEAIYNGLARKIILTCDQGHRFSQLASSHLNGFNCPHCSGLARHTTDEFISKSVARFGDKFDYSKVDYKNSTTPVVLICKEKGEFSIKPYSHLKSSTGYCSELVNEPAGVDAFITKARLIHGDRYDYSQVVYKTNKSSVTIVCEDHGAFDMLAHNHYKGSGCPKCAKIMLESKPEKALKDSLLEYKPTKVQPFDDNRELDIYFESHKVAVEVNGIY